VGDVDGDAEVAADYGLTCVTNDFELLTIRRSMGRREPKSFGSAPQTWRRRTEIDDRVLGRALWLAVEEVRDGGDRIELEALWLGSNWSFTSAIARGPHAA